MGLLHIYCGDGKGKTTASLGLAMRAAGNGMRVCFAQFMKGGATGELPMLHLLPGVTVLRCEKEYGFVWEMSPEELREITDCHNQLLRQAFTSGADMVILDEFNIAYSSGLLDKTLAEQLILDGKAGAEIVLTGRDPSEVFLAQADYISEICCRKHPFAQGIAARKGIEY